MQQINGDGQTCVVGVPCECLMPVHRSCNNLSSIRGVMEPPLQVFQMYLRQVDFDCLVKHMLCNEGTEVTQCK